MSLIDTVCLGRMASAPELAALGPSSLLLTFASYILFGLSIGTVSLLSERLKARDEAGAARTLSTSLFLAAASGALERRCRLAHEGGLLLRLLLSCCPPTPPPVCPPTLASSPTLFAPGLAMGLGFLQFGPQLLRLTGADPAVLAHAAAYLRIRALALPAVLCVQVRCCCWGRACGSSPAAAAGRWRRHSTAECSAGLVDHGLSATARALLSPPPRCCRWRRRACWRSATACPPFESCWPPQR